jgi:hypothetical protein
MSKPASLTYVVRQRVTVPRHLERFSGWLFGDQIPALGKAIPELASVRHYKEEKDELVRLTFYDFKEGTVWTPALHSATRKIREAWFAFGPDMRDFSGSPYSLIWHGGPGPTGGDDQPLIVERLSVLPEKEAEWNTWSEQMWKDEIRDLEYAGVQRYWALEGDPRFYIQIQEFKDDETMRRKIKASEPKTRPQYWEGWAKWMPYVENLSRYVFVPIKGGG